MPWPITNYRRQSLFRLMAPEAANGGKAWKKGDRAGS